jgi:hypothetical protein
LPNLIALLHTRNCTDNSCCAVRSTAQHSTAQQNSAF